MTALCRESADPARGAAEEVCVLTDPACLYPLAGIRAYLGGVPSLVD
ncbi:hypothetical protein ACXIZN_09375 [Amycolatopsis sp. TRM77291]